MAVSLLEATSAQTASQYLPVSRLSARRDFVEQAGVDFCREHSVLPLWREPTGVLVATTRPRDSVMLRELRQALGQPLVVRVSGRGEIRVGINAAVGALTPEAWRRSLAETLEAFRIMRPGQGDTYVFGADDESYLGEGLVSAGILSEAERIELVGLAFHMPSIDLREHPPEPGLASLLDVETLRTMRALPLWSVRSELFLAVESPPAPDMLARLDRQLGLAIRPVLVEPGALRERLAELKDDPPIETAELGDAARRAGLVSQAEFETAVQVTESTAESVSQALQRLFSLTPKQIELALARRAGVDPYRGIDSVDADAVAAIPAALSRTMRVAVIGRSGRDVTLAMVDPWNARTRRALEALLHAEVHPVLASDREVADIIELHGSADGRDVLLVGDPLRTSLLLLEASFVDRRAADVADIDIEHLAREALPRLWQMLENGKRSEAVALDAGLPRVHELLLRPDPAAAALRPEDPDGPALMPLLHEDDVLTVAIASPDVTDEAQKLAGRHQRALRLAVTREDDIDAARRDLALLDLAALSQPHEELGRQLERRFNVSRTDVLGLFRRMQEENEPLDVAAQRRHLLTAVQVCEAMADYLGIPAIDLKRTDRFETTVNDAGVPVTRRVLEDPVDLETARLISMEDAERLGALPVSRAADGRLVLAVADPLNERSVVALEELFGAFYVQPATRSDIREASRRAHGRLTIGDLLLEAGAVTREALEEGLGVAEQSGVRLGEALMSLRTVSEEELGEQLAAQRGIPFYTLRGLELQGEVAALLPEQMIRERGVLPIDLTDGVVTLALADPTDADAISDARETLGLEVTLVGTTRSDIRDALERLYHRAYLEHSAADLLQRFPGDSAHQVLSGGQKVFLISLVVGIAASLWLWPINTLIVLLGLSTFFYLAFSGYKFYLIYRALSHTLEVPVRDEDVAALDDRDLPVYTILVPLYRESEVLPTLVAGLSRLDYPKEKLDVKLLLEEDDPETIAVARLANLPAFFDITIVPDGQPKGKPKACNYGLLHARGEYVVIFDAEDVPEPDQLKRVLLAFRNTPENVVCIQSKLNYYNREQNLLTKWFTTEYSTWFDLFLPGLDASGAPIPLGGTSNHFKVSALRTAGAWDPFNVTEDADLGLRIFKMGGATAVVDTTTFEEANSVLDNWIRQRSRWVKGYIQTYLVHMRHPWRLWNQLGPAGFLSFQLVIGGTFFGFLLNPILWALTGVWFATNWGLIQQVFPGPIYYMGAISLYAGNFAFAYMNVAGCLRRRYYTLVKWALLSPIYWMLMSIAAWKGFLQLFYRPFYWEKTVHGLANVSGLELVEEPLETGR